MSTQLENVLLVDDEPRLLSSLRRRLSSSFNVLTAEGGHEALQLLGQRSDVKVIVADMQMPEMNGIELLKKIKEAHPSIRRIMLTGNSDQETAMAAINEGQVMRFLRKPCDAEELAQVMHQAIEEYDFASNHDSTLAEPQEPSPELSRYELHETMSRELDQQLAHLVNIASTLYLPPEELETANLQPNLADAKRSGEDMLWLVGSMMRMSELKAARETNRVAKRFDLMTALRAELETFRPTADAKSLTISLNSLRKNVEVDGWEGEVRLVLNELCHNAIAYNDLGGHISIIVSTERDQVAMRIFSTGGCIPAEKLRNAVASPAEGGERTSSSRDDLRLKVMMSIAALNGAQCQIQPHETGGMVCLLRLKRGTAGQGHNPVAAAG